MYSKQEEDSQSFHSGSHRFCEVSSQNMLQLSLLRMRPLASLLPMQLLRLWPPAMLLLLQLLRLSLCSLRPLASLLPLQLKTALQFSAPRLLPAMEIFDGILERHSIDVLQAPGPLPLRPKVRPQASRLVVVRIPKALAGSPARAA